MLKTRLTALFLLAVGVLIGAFTYYSNILPATSWLSHPFKLGLDLSGGSHLVYQGDVSNLPAADVPEAMSSLRDVIERRVNAFGVGEPIVQVEESGQNHRLIVELPGVTDLTQAVKSINATPVLEFRTERAAGREQDAILAAYKAAEDAQTAGRPIPLSPLLAEHPYFVKTELTGRYVKHASVQFGQQSITPSVELQFNADGAKLFSAMTQANVGKPIGIFLDGELISSPVVREAIRNGQAEISGNFTLDEAKELTRNLNLGALPVPITLLSTETVGPTLGADALNRGLQAGIIGFLVVALFMVLWYRLPGFIAVISLGCYAAIVLAIFKLLPVTLTAAGIAGFILSIGIAVDANVLIFERLKEELRSGRDIQPAITDGFGRAWTSIRDSNLSSIITAVILFWFGTSVVKGFALTLIIGILVSMFTAITLTRTFLLALNPQHKSGVSRFLFGSGLGGGAKVTNH